MLIELSIIPLGEGTHLSGPLAEILAEIDASGLTYQLTPTATCLEGEWDELMPVVKACHELARRSSVHVVTTIKVDDEEDADNKLVNNVLSVEEKVGHRLGRIEPEHVRLGPSKAHSIF